MESVNKNVIHIGKQFSAASASPMASASLSLPSMTCQRYQSQWQQAPHQQHHYFQFKGTATRGEFGGWGWEMEKVIIIDILNNIIKINTPSKGKQTNATKHTHTHQRTYIHTQTQRERERDEGKTLSSLFLYYQGPYLSRLFVCFRALVYWGV